MHSIHKQTFSIMIYNVYNEDVITMNQTLRNWPFESIRGFITPDGTPGDGNSGGGIAW